MGEALTAVNDHEALTDSATSPPECFGLRPSLEHDPACRACPVQMMCLHRFAHRTMPQAAAQVGSFVRDYIAESLALHTGALSRRQANASVQKSLAKPPDNAWPRRYMAERRRHPDLCRLPVGTKLLREFDGIQHCVVVEDGHYSIGPDRFPTLFCAGMAITGRHPVSGARGRKRPHLQTGQWSVRKLFGPAIAEAAQSTRT